ncbi:MAG: Mitochondrial distribution and morphology protein 12 [Thelocarpon superellum]|nr:MAG: Mitochondrial distribution and morphology protein 12 [Thelocarpon superellum]
MSIEINWAALTTGPDGLALADRIRDFLHRKFQEVTLPRFIQSVKVHSFEFGTTAPEIVLKDVCDPLPDFYEGEEDSGEEEHEGIPEGGRLPSSGDGAGHIRNLSERRRTDRLWRRNDLSGGAETAHLPSPLDTRGNAAWPRPINSESIASPVLGVTTPGIPGGTSNLGYFHLPLSAGISGTQTPLAAVVGAQFQAQRGEHGPSHRGETRPGHRHTESIDSPTPPSTSSSGRQGLSGLSPSSPSAAPHEGKERSQTPNDALHARRESPTPSAPSVPAPLRIRERHAEDYQVISRVRYAGDIKLSLTAEILLDYPMPSFVGIPLRLNITGLSFDGVAVTAYIRKRAHFCFLSPEDGHALIASEGEEEWEAASRIPPEPQPPSQAQPPSFRAKVVKSGGLLHEIRVESEIGQRENGKQSLKNVGKVEKFVLDQVRRIFEDEVVYPSFWTFLV